MAKLECSKSTPHRAINSLKNHLNAPVVFDAEAGGYKYGKRETGEAFELPGLWLTAHGLQALALMQRLIKGAAVAQYAGSRCVRELALKPSSERKLEGLTRYVSRPPVSVEPLDLTAQGQVRCRPKTPYRDGTTHIVLEPLDFARLAALVPPPREHLTRFHGVFAAHAALRVIASIEEPELMADL